MKKIVLLFLINISFFGNIFGQAKKPTLMILPSDNWCEQRYFMSTYDDQGTQKKVPNYKQAFQEDTELGQVISKIGGLMVDKGFPLKDAEQEIKLLEARRAEDNMTESKTSGSSISESPLDMLKKTAKSDILVQIWWKVNKESNGKSVSFTLEALDSYTGKRIASSTGNSEASNDIVPELLLKAVESHISTFSTQLQAHFDDLFTNGREVSIYIKKWDSWEYDLEEEYDGEELSDIIDTWMYENTVSHRYSLTDVTENYMRFEQVRIPVYNDKGRPLDSRAFIKELRKVLKAEPYNFEVKLMTRGLGEAILVLGEK